MSLYQGLALSLLFKFPKLFQTLAGGLRLIELAFSLTKLAMLLLNGYNGIFKRETYL